MMVRLMEVPPGSVGLGIRYRTLELWGMLGSIPGHLGHCIRKMLSVPATRKLTGITL